MTFYERSMPDCVIYVVMRAAIMKSRVDAECCCCCCFIHRRSAGIGLTIIQWLLIF